MVVPAAIQGRKESVDIEGLIREGRHRDAASALAREHGGTLGRLCMALLASQSEAEEAVQQGLGQAMAGRTVLVEDGILKSYLHDEISAKQYDLSPTGSGRRESYKYAPMPRMSCTFMEGGPHTKEEIIAAVDHGIICETYTNGQVQIGAGDYTFYTFTYDGVRLWINGQLIIDQWVDQAKTLAAGGETEFSKKVEDGDVY